MQVHFVFLQVSSNPVYNYLSWCVKLLVIVLILYNFSAISFVIFWTLNEIFFLSQGVKEVLKDSIYQVSKVLN